MKQQTEIDMEMSLAASARLREDLEIRAYELREILNSRKEALKGAPEGNLIAENREKGPYYFFKGKENKKRKKYIKKKDFDLAVKLAQRDYDRLVAEAATDELAEIERFLEALAGGIRPEEIGETLSPARRTLVSQIYLSDEEFVKVWEAQPFRNKEISPEGPRFYTAKNERVRSKSEKIIADLLREMGVPYKYEASLWLPKSGFELNPDFTILDVAAREEKYLEHFGMMDDPAYSSEVVRKLNHFENNGIYLGEKLLITYETGRMPLDTQLLRKQIEHFLRL